MQAWFDGHLMHVNDVAIHATDRGFLLGDGFFETLAAQNGRTIHLSRHLKRLEETAAFFHAPLPYDTDDLIKAIHDVLTGSHLTQCRASVRITVSRGAGPRGLLPPLELKPHVLITASDVPESFSSARVCQVSLRRNETSPASAFKTLSYMDNILAFEEAHARTCDEALMLNSQGFIAEGAISNIFFIQQGTLLTPRKEDGILPGITRQLVLESAADLGLGVEEKALSPDIIQSCEEAFLTNSLVRVRPIYEIDGRKIPSETISRKLLDHVISLED